MFTKHIALLLTLSSDKLIIVHQTLPLWVTLRTLTRNRELLGPVHHGSTVFANLQPEKVRNVLNNSSVKWRLVDTSSYWLEMSVSGCIHPFISCHCQDSYLIDLANSKTGNPDTMKQCHQQNEQNPRCTHGSRLESEKISIIFVRRTGRGQINVASPHGGDG